MELLPRRRVRPRRASVTEDPRLLWLLQLRRELVVNRIRDGNIPSGDMLAELHQAAADVWVQLA